MAKMILYSIKSLESFQYDPARIHLWTACPAITQIDPHYDCNHQTTLFPSSIGRHPDRLAHIRTSLVVAWFKKPNDQSGKLASFTSLAHVSVILTSISRNLTLTCSLVLVVSREFTVLRPRMQYRFSPRIVEPRNSSNPFPEKCCLIVGTRFSDVLPPHRSQATAFCIMIRGARNILDNWALKFQDPTKTGQDFLDTYEITQTWCGDLRRKETNTKAGSFLLAYYFMVSRPDARLSNTGGLYCQVNKRYNSKKMAKHKLPTPQRSDSNNEEQPVSQA